MTHDFDRTPPGVPPQGGAGSPPLGGRRRILQALSAAPVGRSLLQAGVGAALARPGATLAATPICGDPAEPTQAQTEGPYFTPNSPRRRSLLEEPLPGTRLVLSGRVLATDCAPLSAVLLDFWQADAAGKYDNQGYRLRGHQFSDDHGRYRLQTVLPGIYPGRTRHIHVKVQAANGPVLTTQLYFPGEVRNSRDSIFSPALLVTVAQGTEDRSPGEVPGGELAMNVSFDFVIVRN